MFLSRGPLHGREIVVVPGPWNLLKIHALELAENPSLGCQGKLLKGRCLTGGTPLQNCYQTGAGEVAHALGACGGSAAESGIITPSSCRVFPASSADKT